MAKLSLRRLLIRNGPKLYRPVALSFERDKYSEPFVKFILPDLAKMDTEQFAGSDPNADSSVSIGSVPKGLQEFSYHYLGGVMHFKHRDLGYMEQERRVHTLSPSYLIKVLRLIIYDIQHLEPYTKKVTSHDFVFPPEWSGKPRILSVYLAHTGTEVRMEVESSRPLGGLQITTTVDPNVRVLITDEEMLGPFPPKGVLGVYIPNEKVVLPA